MEERSFLEKKALTVDWYIHEEKLSEQFEGQGNNNHLSKPLRKPLHVKVRQAL